MRDMKAKFGAEVESFRYAFVVPNHGSEWDGANTLDPEDARSVLAKARAEAQAQRSAPQAPALAKPGAEASAPAMPRRRASDRQPTFIEIKPRNP
jgi:hypothetical protein